MKGQNLKWRNERDSRTAKGWINLLYGLKDAEIAAIITGELKRRAGKWGEFKGPQSEMTARFWELVRLNNERTSPTYSLPIELEMDSREALRYERR